MSANPAQLNRRGFLGASASAGLVVAFHGVAGK
jgi:uncharacterized protein (DUF1501 family)